MLYADDAEVTSHLPTQLMKMMGVIVVVCAAFGLTVPEAKTEIICQRAMWMPEATTMFSVEAAGEIYNQTNEFVYLGEHQPLQQSVHRGRQAHTQRMVHLPEGHPRTVLPTERPPRAEIPDAESQDIQDNVVRLHHVKPARVPLRPTATNPPQRFDSLHRL